MTRDELISVTIEQPKDEIFYQVKRIVDNLPKPLNGLGKFEDIICKIASIQDTTSPDIKNKALVVMCADNGILEEGVTELGGYMTGLIAKKMADGESSVNYMADIAGMKVVPVDIGINGDVEGKNLVIHKIAKGTKNFIKEPAMTDEQMLEAIATGIEITKKLKDEGCGIICTGDMGIGNTTTAVALICAILEGDPVALTGRGAGSSDSIYKRKLDAVFKGLQTYGYDGSGDMYNSIGSMPYGVMDAGLILDMAKNLGGLDIAGLIGIFIGGAINHIPVVVDGILPAAAALAADNIIPGCKDYMLGSHFGKEPATEIVFQELNLDPVINADMDMGEGVGAVMLMPMLDMVMSMYDNLATEVEDEEAYD